MKTTAMAGGIVLMFLATAMVASAYHISGPRGPTATDHAATQWQNTAATGLVIDVCESQGDETNDKVNPNPANLVLRGQGGLCYASANLNGTTKEETDPKKNKPAFNDKALKDVTQTEWSRLEPTCEPLSPNPQILLDPGDPALGCPAAKDVELDWFARVGNNANGCNGQFANPTLTQGGSVGNAIYYPEALAWWVGAGPKPNGTASGHVTFFVNGPLQAGSYLAEKPLSQAILEAAQGNTTKKEQSPGGIVFCSAGISELPS